MCKYKSNKLNFEIICNSGKIKLYRDGKAKLDDVIMSKEIFLNFKKGIRPKESDLQNAFKTTEIDQCIDIILKKGEFQISTDERKEEVEKKRLQIIEYIHKYYVDPKTKQPHPSTRIQNALEQIKGLRIDPDQPVDKQVDDLLPKITNFIQLSRQEMEGFLTIPNQYIGQSQGIIKKFATIKQQKYNETGAIFEIGFVPGEFDAFMHALNGVTHGEYNFEDPSVGRKDIKEAKTKPGKKGKKR